MSPYKDWQNQIVNRNFFILQNLQKNPLVDKILAVDFLPRKMKQGLKYYYRNLMTGLKNAEIIYGDLTSDCYQVADKIYAYSSIDAVWSAKTVIKELNKIKKKLNFNNLIIWSYNPMFLDFINKMDYQLFVFDTVDNWTEHPGYLKLMKRKKLLANYKKIAQKADIIFTVSKELLDFYKKFDRMQNISWIPNGVDFDHYTNSQNYQKPTAIDNETKPIIGYIGTIQDRLDFDLIKFIAEKNKDKIIVLGGPVWKSVKKEIESKLNLPNIKFLGRINWQDAPAYLNKFDVCIIPHKLDKFIKSTNPMKMYEYLALGKPIITTEGAGIKDFEKYLYIANDNEKFNQLIQKALAEDADEIKAKRIEIAKQQDWSKRVSKMLDLISEQI